MGTLYMFTLHRGDTRIGLELGFDLELLTARAKTSAKAFGDETTYRLWQCTELDKLPKGNKVTRE